LKVEKDKVDQDLEGRIAQARHAYRDAHKAVVVCGETSRGKVFNGVTCNGSVPCAEGFLSNGEGAARKCDCWRNRAQADRELNSVGREWKKATGEEYSELFPHIGSELEAKWRAEKRDHDPHPSDPSRFHELEVEARSILSGMDLDVPEYATKETRFECETDRPSSHTEPQDAPVHAQGAQ